MYAIIVLFVQKHLYFSIAVCMSVSFAFHTFNIRQKYAINGTLLLVSSQIFRLYSKGLSVGQICNLCGYGIDYNKKNIIYLQETYVI